MATHSYSRPWILTIIGAILLIFFCLWLFRILIPVVIVETKYQYQKILRDVFQVTDIRGLIMPQFHYDWRGNSSKNATNGIFIAKIFVDEPVVFNVDPNDANAYQQALRFGIAHASGTSFPGKGGLGYYFAHSSTPEFARQYNAVFYLLGKLKGGERITLWHGGKDYAYKVTRTQITEPNDTSFLATTQYEKETIVLQTCWPPGTTNQRLLVFAERDEE